MSSDTKIVLLTGFPTSFLAKRVLWKLLEDGKRRRIRCIVQPHFMERAQEELAGLPAQQRGQVELLEGDAAAMDLCLSGAEYMELAREIDIIHHCAAVTYFGVERQVAERTNIGGAREMLELAEAADHLERLVHWSTALVSGARRGYVLEEELSAPEGFRNIIEETRFRAERIVREAMNHVPTTILRPSIIVGDSASGEVDRFEGPYLLVLLMLNSPVDLRMPMPGRGDIPLNLVPIEYAVDAGCHIASDPRPIGRTFHIVDPEPLTAKRVFELVAKAAGRPLPRGFLPTNVATALMRTPGLERFATVPRAFLEQLATEVVWDDRNARELLADAGLECPTFESYVDTMVRYVREQQAERRASSVETALEDADL